VNKVDRFAIAILDTISAVLGSVPFAWILNPSQDLTDIPPRGTVLGFVVFALALIGLRLIIIWVVNNTRKASLWQHGTCFLEHFLFSRPDSLVPLSDRARKLLKSRDSRMGISLGASLRLREAEWVIGRKSPQCLTKQLRCDDSGIEIAFAPVRLAAHNFSR